MRKQYTLGGRVKEAVYYEKAVLWGVWWVTGPSGYCAESVDTVIKQPCLI